MPHPVALITGAGSGIGRAAAIALASAGYDLALVGRRKRTLSETAGLFPSRSATLVLPADISDATQARDIVNQTLARFGRLDALINNAGDAPNTPIEKHTPDLIDRVFRINAIGPANTIARAWPTFVNQSSGCIVNVATIGISDPFPGFFAYAAAKAALATMTLSCATEGAPHHIRAYCIAPGAVETPMFRAFMPESAFPRSRTLSPESVARVILECVQNARPTSGGRPILLKNPD